MEFTSNKQKGRAGLAMAIGYYGSHGYNVLLPLNDTQDYDLVIEKEGTFLKVNAKATGSSQSTNKDAFSVELRHTGGTKGGIYGNVLEESADILFCLDAKSRMYHIPIADIRAAGIKNTFSLVSKRPKTANKSFFDSSVYLVS